MDPTKHPPPNQQERLIEGFYTEDSSLKMGPGCLVGKQITSMSTSNILWEPLHFHLDLSVATECVPKLLGPSSEVRAIWT